jgi:hypothetical protein
VVVASPELIRVRARTVGDMRLANALCLFVEIAAEQHGADERVQLALSLA